MTRLVWNIEGQATHGSSSGGPVANERGELIGVVSGAGKSADTFTATPADLALANINQAREQGRGGLRCLQKSKEDRR
jgi:S1-C subfamily serine protease